MPTDLTPDQVTAYLDEVRKRHALVTGPEAGNFSRLNDLHAASYDLSHGDAPRLLAAVDAALALAAKHEHGATRWEDPLPVPTWIPQIREAISRSLLGEGQ